MSRPSSIHRTCAGTAAAARALLDAIRPRGVTASASEVAVGHMASRQRSVAASALSRGSTHGVNVIVESSRNVLRVSQRRALLLVVENDNSLWRTFSSSTVTCGPTPREESDNSSTGTTKTNANGRKKSEESGDTSISGDRSSGSTPPPSPQVSSSVHPPSPFIDPLPLSLQPYARLARLDKPIGTMLLLWPCCWSTALAAPPGCLPDPKLLALFATGSFVMRGAGCTINDMWDAEYDKSVARTKARPLASGELSHGQALTFLAAQLTVGLGVLLSLPHTAYTFQVGAASLPLVMAYPLMKRYTNWPQLVLGMTFNWGALVGWASVHGSIDWSVVGPLYGSGIAWTLVYDTLYAHQDKVDDNKLGLKSTALHFAGRTKPILHGFSALAVASWMAAGCALDFSSPLYYCGCAAAYSHLVWQIQTADLDDPSNLAQRFKSNNQIGMIVFAACVAGNLTAAGVSA